MRTGDNAEEYYKDLTEFINENSGLDVMSVETVKWVCRISKKYVGNHEDSEPSRTPRKYNAKRPCSARRTNGEPCRKPALNGSNVCRTHGGAAKQTVNKARIRLQNAAFEMAKELLNMATDENVSDAVKLKAITEALDRGGLAVKSSVDVDISVKPHDAIFERISGGSRAAYRGESANDDNQPALVASHYDAIDVQIVEDDLDDDNPADLNVFAQPITPESYENPSVFDSTPSPLHREPPAEGLLPLDQANEVIAQQRRVDAGHAHVHRGQRALPPGKSARR